MTTDAVGGVWSYSMNMCNWLTAAGAEVLLAVMGPQPSKSQRAETALCGLTLVDSEFELEWSLAADDESLAASGKWLLSLEQQFKPDVIHLNGYAHASLPWRAPVMVVAHSCVCSWWSAVHDCMAPTRWDHYRRHVRRGLKNADAVVAPTRWMLSQLERIYCTPCHLSAVISNFATGDKVEHAKQSYICAVGRIWDAAKNFRILDTAAERIDWPVIAFGETRGPDGNECHPGHLSLQGAQSRLTVFHALASASIFVHPALYEPFGLCVLEAALHQCALVLADIPSLRELWEGAALFVKANDVDGWVDALQQMIDDADLRLDYGKRAAERSGRYSKIRSMRQYQNLYRTLIMTSSRTMRPKAVVA